MLEGTSSFWYNGRYLKEKRIDMTQIIDGKALAAKLQGQLAEKTAKLKEETGLVPGLVVILVGKTLPVKSTFVTRRGQPLRLDSVVKLCEFQIPLLKRNC